MFQNLTYADLYDTDTAIEIQLELMLQEIGNANKSNKGNKVSAPKFKTKLAKPVKKFEPVEVATIEEVMELAEEVIEIAIDPVDYLVEVDTIEEVMGLEPKSEPVIDEEFSDEGAEVVEETEELAPVNKICDVELATKVAMDILEGNIPDMRIEDFLPEVWAEGWMIANESYYSEPNNDDEDEVMPSGETIMKLSDKNKDFLINRTKSIASWKQEDGAKTNEVSDEYIYEDDEVNVLEECDATLMGFRKGFWCMGLAA